jgi:translation initiation factor 2 beta subunit (eIF-2beta)/eIF-5
VLQKITSLAMLSIVKCKAKGAYRCVKETKEEKERRD